MRVLSIKSEALFRREDLNHTYISLRLVVTVRVCTKRNSDLLDAKQIKSGNMGHELFQVLNFAKLC